MDREEVKVNASQVNFQPLTNSGRLETPTFFADELVNEIFDAMKEKEGMGKYSSSACLINMPIAKSKHKVADDDDMMDPRLASWHKMLKQRKAIQQRIQSCTGKRAEDVLFNRHVTIDNQTKKMLLHVLESAKRSEEHAPDRVYSVLKTRIDQQTCREIRELQVTDPKLQKLEFVGLPQVTQLELAGVVDPPESCFQRSQLLAKQLHKNEENIKRVLSYCPHLDSLQVAPGFEPRAVPLMTTQFLGEDELLVVSPETSEHALKRNVPKLKVEKKPAPIKHTPSTNQIRINGTPHGFGDMQGALSSELHLVFQCDPFQRMRKTIVYLENISDKFLIGKWKQIKMYNKELIQHQASTGDFVFDARPFALLPGHARRIDAMYMPMTVGVKKQSWMLHLQRSPFCGMRRITLRLHGVCTAPACFRQRIDRDQQLVVDNRNQQVADRLTKFHAELAPIVEPPRMDCPYQRRLDERELFSAQNLGFQCSRFTDLETLKELYVLVKKPRQPAWDYSIETVRQCIYQHEPKQRETLQKLLLDIIEPMRCSSKETFSKIDNSMERQRTCFIYVRGIISSAFEEWHVLAETLSEQFYKSEAHRFIIGVNDLGEELPNEEEIDAHVSKRVNSCKYFKDALYIQTYTLLCDAAENIVSAIESNVHL
ncbi:uncharacterized protein LOC117571057 [Drosophila albomicans]|uniref:Uncharacterized protein LOC117571057 n=1 Tax=Drosophila albomicans TaxID=7291 RepID=A0A6P8YSY9_DROAB|nr:uncharacterized protein LOC117571057 [Drosophila albomicans]